jgi:hypothetical protein
LTIHGPVDFSGKKKQKITPWYIMETDSAIGQIYELLVIFATTYSIFATPLVFVFPVIYAKTISFEWVVDFIFLGDVITNFFTSTTKQHVTLNAVIRNYLLGFFILDLACCIPSLATGEVIEWYYLKSIRFVRIHRVFDIQRIAMNKCFYERGISKSKVGEISYFFKLVTFIILIVHLLACYWMWLGLLNKTEGWIYVNDFISDSDIYNLYAFSAYYIVQTITTVGYGDYAAGTQKEYIFMIFCEFVGVCVFSILSASMSTLFGQGIA